MNDTESHVFHPLLLPQVLTVAELPLVVPWAIVDGSCSSPRLTFSAGPNVAPTFPVELAVASPWHAMSSQSFGHVARWRHHFSAFHLKNGRQMGFQS